MSDFVAFFVGLLALVPGLGPAVEPSWAGYVEANYVYVAPAGGGIISEIAGGEGQVVEAGAVLVQLEDAQQRALLRAAEARVEVARANVANLATGSRDDEVAVIRASLDKAEADLALARLQSARSDKLLAEGLIPEAKADQDRASLASAEAQVAQLSAQLRVAELPARDPQRVAAEASLLAAEADADKARADLADRTLTAPVAGRIERVYFDAGEMVPTGTAVLALQPEGALKVKFYLPEAERSAMTIGQQVRIGCDGCGEAVTATVSFLASDPQFTPPVIYSREERTRLSFLAEATLSAGESLPPGQPVTVAK